MKKRSAAVFAVMIALVLALTAICFACGEGDPVPDTKTLVEIKVTTMPTKTAYHTGETFDRTGMVVTAVYDDDSEVPVTGYTVDKTGELTLSDTKVTVTYQGKSTSFDITVTQAPPQEEEDPSENIAPLLTFDKNGLYRVEAEDIDPIEWGCTLSGANYKEARPNASGGYALGCLSVLGNVYGIVFENNSGENKVLDLTFCVSDFTKHDSVFDEKVTCTLNGEAFATGGQVPAYVDEMPAYTWVTFTVNDLEVVPGRNVFAIENTDGAYNYDYFDFNIRDVGSEAIDKTKYDVVMENDATVLLEAESCDLEGLIPVNDTVTDFFENPAWASGGYSIGKYSAGSDLSIDVYVAEDCKLTFYASMAYSSLGSLALDGTVTFKLGDETLTTGVTLSGYNDDKQYWNFEKVKIFEKDLTAGEYTITIEFVSATPNIDYFEFTMA